MLQAAARGRCRGSISYTHLSPRSPTRDSTRARRPPSSRANACCAVPTTRSPSAPTPRCRSGSGSARRSLGRAADDIRFAPFPEPTQRVDAAELHHPRPERRRRSCTPRPGTPGLDLTARVENLFDETTSRRAASPRGAAGCSSDSPPLSGDRRRLRSRPCCPARRRSSALSASERARRRESLLRFRGPGRVASTGHPHPGPHGAPSREIDRVVRDCLRRGDSLYQLDGVLESLGPT